MATKKVAVIGYPVMHSSSPKLHNFWLKSYNIDAEYGFLEVKPEDFEKTILSLRDNGYVGVNITVPYKENAYNLVDIRSEAANNTGAVNTIYFDENGNMQGTNTDPYGFLRNIISKQENFEFKAGKAVVIGAGGAARAVVAGLVADKATDVVIVNRTRRKAEDIRDEMQHLGKGRIEVASWGNRSNVISEAHLLVNTTTLGMQGQLPLDISLDKLPKTALVNDIVYRPLETDLLRNARLRGNPVVDGLGMLLYQAQLSFKFWFGIEPKVDDILREYILATKN